MRNGKSEIDEILFSGNLTSRLNVWRRRRCCRFYRHVSRHLVCLAAIHQQHVRCRLALVLPANTSIDKYNKTIKYLVSQSVLKKVKRQCMTLSKNSVCVKGTLGYFRNHCLPRCRFSHHECLLWWGERDASGWRHGRRGCVVIRRASSNWQILLEAKNICSIKKWYSRYILAHIILLKRRKKC